jgi:hypothetical protein
MSRIMNRRAALALSIVAVFTFTSMVAATQSEAVDLCVGKQCKKAARGAPFQRPQPWQRWANQVKAPQVTGVLRLRFGDCGPHQACGWTFPVNIGLQSRAKNTFQKHLLWHELGHAFDFIRMSPRLTRAGTQRMSPPRRVFRRLLGCKRSRGWHQGPLRQRCDERFADAYMFCSASMTNPPSFGPIYVYRPSASQHRRVCRTMKRDRLLY